MTDDTRNLYTVAQLLKLAEKTPHIMAQKAELPALEVGGQWRFRHENLRTCVNPKTRRAPREEKPK